MKCDEKDALEMIAMWCMDKPHSQISHDHTQPLSVNRERGIPNHPLQADINPMIHLRAQKEKEDKANARKII